MLNQVSQQVPFDELNSETIDKIITGNKYEYKNGRLLIESLERHLANIETAPEPVIDFFEIVNQKNQLRSCGFLKGRIHELLQTNLYQLKDENTRDRLVAIFNSMITEDQATQYTINTYTHKDKDIEERKLFKCFNDHFKFITTIEDDSFLAGKLLERVRSFVLKHKDNETMILERDFITVNKLFDLYVLMSNIIPGDNDGFFACIIHLKTNKTFNQILGYLAILEDLPIELRNMVLRGQTPKEAIESIQKYINGGVILSTPNRKEQFKAVIKKITSEWGRENTNAKPLDEELTTDLPEELNGFEQPNTFYEELLGLCRLYQSMNKHKKLFKFLEGLHIEEKFLRICVLDAFNDLVIANNKDEFEEYRKSLKLSEKHVIYQSLKDESSKTSPTNSLSASPPKQAMEYIPDRNFVPSLI